MVHLSGDGSYIYPYHASVSIGVAFDCNLWSRRLNIGNSYSLFYTYYNGGPNDGSHFASYTYGVAMITSSWSRSSFRGNHDGMEFPNPWGNPGGSSSSIECGVAHDHFYGRGVPELVTITLSGQFFLMVP